MKQISTRGKAHAANSTVKIHQIIVINESLHKMIGDNSPQETTNQQLTIIGRCSTIKN